MPKNRVEKNRAAVFSVFVVPSLKAQGRQRLYPSPSIRQGRLAHGKAAQGIGAEFAKRSEANWSGKPDPAFGGGAPKNQKGKPDFKSNTAYSRVCQTPFADPKARSKGEFA
jgi:hypothetical protein